MATPHHLFVYPAKLVPNPQLNILFRLCKQRILFATNTSKNLFVNIQKKIQKKQIFKQKKPLTSHPQQSDE